MKWFEDFQRRNAFRAIGLMSGTSADGLDIALINIEKSSGKPGIELGSFSTQLFPDSVRELILNVAAPDGGTVEDVCSLNCFLGHLFSNNVLDFLIREGIERREIDFIGSHGQTICHLPQKVKGEGIEFSSTLQIADPSVIANRTNILTVGDFRVADMALGGQGAPLVPFFDTLYFGHNERNRIILNIGGIANLTALQADKRLEEIIAFDTGPGNVLIDALTKELFQKPFDRDGELARSGYVHEKLLHALLDEDYFDSHPPKSTGRELFAGTVLQRILAMMETDKIEPVDVLRTVTELTARSIFEATQKFLDKNIAWDELIVSGGGAENKLLMERISKYFRPTRIVMSVDAGIPGEAKEALCFALLAYHTLMGLPGNLPSVTGAAEQTILGKICVPLPNRN